VIRKKTLLGSCFLLATGCLLPSASQSVIAEAILPDPLKAGWQGTQVCALIHEDDKLRILRCVFPPGVGHERHFHPRHVGYVLEGGTMQITDSRGTRTVGVKTGTSFSSDGIVWHEALNVGDTTSSYLMIEPKS